MAHSIQIPEWMWELAQERSGMTNPATFLRDILSKSFVENTAHQNAITNRTVIRDDLFDGELLTSEQYEVMNRRAVLGIGPNPLDPVLDTAWTWYSEIAGGQFAALNDLEERVANGLRSPKAFILNRYRARKQEG